MTGGDGGRQRGAGARDGSPHAGLRRGTTERAVLEVLCAEAGALTRAEIARRTAVSAPSISDAVRRLEEAGVITGAGRAAGRPGAVATLYEIAPAAGVVVAVEVGDGVIRAAACDLVGRVLEDESREWSLPSDPQVDLDAVLDDIGRRHGDDGCPVRAVAVSVAHPVGPDRALGLAGTSGPGAAPSVAAVRGVDPRLLVLDSDVHFAARAERDRGVAAGVDTFAHLLVGEGHRVGLGLMVGERVVRGACGRAGEIAALPVGDDGGRSGLGAVLAGCGLRAHADGRLPVPDVARAARALGEAVATMCAVIDPEVVVVGGPVGAAPGLLAGIEATVAALAPRPIPIVPTAVGASAPLLGALVEARARAWASMLATRG